MGKNNDAILRLAAMDESRAVAAADRPTPVACTERTKKIEWVQAFINRHSIGVKSKYAKEGLCFFELDHCAFNPEHEKAAIIVAENGLGYKCFHDSCKSNHWKDFRRLFEKSGVLDDFTDDLDSPTLGGKKGRKSAADQLLEYIDGSCLSLFRDEHGIGYGAVIIGVRQEIHSLNSKAFRLWLHHVYYQRTGKALAADALKMCQQTLMSKAAFDSPVRRLSLRIAKGPDGSFYYDLGDKTWAAIRIDNYGYSVIGTPPILCIRKANTGAQLMPTKGGKGIWEFLNFVNIKNKADQRLLMVYLCLCCVPEIPRMVLVAHGEKGAGKSFLLRLVRRIVDPAGLELQTVPHDKGELALTLASSAFIAFDNVDYLQAWQSDYLCQASTGGGVKKRELYTDDDEVILKFRHSVALCGIGNVVTRPDLMDRALLIELARIEPAERKAESEIEAEFDKERPFILDDVFTIIAKARRIVDSIKTRNLPRMADAARWGAAIAEAMGIGQDQFFDDLAVNGATANDESIRANPVAFAILQFMVNRPQWDGTASELLEALRMLAYDEAISTSARSWPGSATALSRKIIMVRSNLMDADINIEFYRTTDSTRKRRIKICNTSPLL